MQPHGHMLDQLRREIAEQRNEWEAICEALAGLRPDTHLYVDPAILAEIDAACSAAPAGSARLPRGLRA